MTVRHLGDLIDHATGVEQQIIEVVRKIEQADSAADAGRCAALLAELDELQSELASAAEAMARHAA